MTAPAHTKASRKDWLDAARSTLIDAGEEQVKVALLGARLGVSRSSFYWYFRDRQDLRDALLAEWEATNTAALVAHAQAPAPTITHALCNVFRCFLGDAPFHAPLDFAIRDWARRDAIVKAQLETNEADRLAALSEMFVRFGYAPTEAFVRARVLYYMQVGYNAAELNESLEARLALIPHYVTSFSGQAPDAAAIDAFAAQARAHTPPQRRET